MKIKVLFINNFCDGTGWSKAGIDTLLALDAVGIDVVARSISLNGKNCEVPARVSALKQKKFNHGDPDVVIQNVLPHMADFNGKISRNICLYYTETSNFKSSSWARSINAIGEGWVLNEQGRQASLASGVTVPIHIVPQACNIEKFRKSYSTLPFRNEMKDKFIFYTVGEFNRRKNLNALIKAFHTEFSADEPVELVIKTTNIQKKEVEKLCADIKNNLRIYPTAEQYKQEIIIVDYYTDEAIMKLHSSCDCFVSTSYGEAWCLPAFDAQSLGKSVICPNSTGFRAYVDENTGWLVPTVEEPVFGAQHTFPDMFTSRENWWSVNQLELQKTMRLVYEDGESRKRKSIAGISKAEAFSYKNVGKIILNILENP